MRLLCLGDIHLGRRPSKLTPEVLARTPAEQLGPAAALHLSVRKAIDLNVDAVLFAGDVVEQADDYYEAYGDLDRAVRGLEAKGIAVYAVAGNHDTLVLPRLADAIPGLHLLGRGGNWEAVDVDGADGSSLRLVGWSFPEPRVSINPVQAGLAARLNTADRGIPCIGLLHCDRDQTRSPYAPVRSTDLEAAAVDAWLLGHVHRPDALAGSRPIGYLGSLSPLDPGEAGSHGPWLVEVAGAGRITATHLPLAPLRFEALDVSATGIEAVPDIDMRITDSIRDLHRGLQAQGVTARVVACRVRIGGRGPSRLEFERWLAAGELGRLVLDLDEISYFIEKYEIGLEPEIPLERLAQGDDPAGVLARKLLILQRPAEDGERRKLVERALPRLAVPGRAPIFAGLGRQPPDEDEAARLLGDAGMRALESLLAQRDPTEPETGSWD